MEYVAEPATDVTLQYIKVYRTISAKFIKAEATWEFLAQCKLNGVYPKSILNIKLPVKSYKALQNTRRICLRIAITDARRRMYNLKEARTMNLNQLRRLGLQGTTNMLEACDIDMTILKRKAKLAHIKKLRWLFQTQLKKKQSNPALQLNDVAVVIGDIQLPEVVKETLMKGPSCAFRGKTNPGSLIPPFERILADIPELDKERYRWRFVEEIMNPYKKNKERNYCSTNDKRKLYDTNVWMRDNDITLTRDDKSRKVVLLKKQLYEEHLNTYIAESKAELLNKDPTEALNNELNMLLRNKNFPTFLRPKKVPNPVCPRLFAYAKTHKTPIAFRPIVEKRRSPTYNLEKTVAKWMNGYLKDHPYTVTSSQDFLNRARSITLEGGETLATYDFDKLYPSLNIAPVCLNLYRFFLEKIPDASAHAELFRDLAYLLCHRSYFTFNDKFYKQSQGVPIGSPLAGTLAELILTTLEKSLLSTTIRPARLYTRYVDDVFAIWEEGTDPEDLPIAFTLQPYGLKLKLEQMSQDNVHFLDADLKVNGNRFSTKVYRKPSSNTVIVPNWSDDKWTHKKAALRSLIQRAITHCNTENNFKEEMNNIQEAAKKHGYSTRLLNKLLNEIRYKWQGYEGQDTHTDGHLHPDREQRRQDYTIVPEQLRDSLTVKRIITRTKKKPAHKRPPTLYNLLRNEKDVRKQNEKTGVYQIPFTNLDQGVEELYVGATKRNLKDRISEHRRDIVKAHLTTALARRAFENDINIKWEDARIIKEVGYTEELTTAESVQIYKLAKDNRVVNDKQQDSLQTAWKYLLSQPGPSTMRPERRYEDRNNPAANPHTP